MKIEKQLRLYFVLLIIAATVAIIATAEADEDECRQGHRQCGHDDGGGVVEQGQEQDQHQSQEQDQHQGQEQGQDQQQSSEQANQQSVSFNSARRAPTNFLYMQNQVEACGRTFGISGSNTSGGWAFGIPIPRSWTPTCDLWKAAEEAQQNGFVFTSYMFQCSIKAVHKVLGAETCGKFEHMAMVEMGFVDPPPDLTEIYDRAAKYDERWLMADITQKEYEQQQEVVEYRYEQQQTLIEEMEVEHAKDDAKIKKLEQRVEHEVNQADARRAAVREKIAEKEATDGSEGSNK